MGNCFNAFFIVPMNQIIEMVLHTIVILRFTLW